jgi:hypothetical protein
MLKPYDYRAATIKFDGVTYTWDFKQGAFIAPGAIHTTEITVTFVPERPRECPCGIFRGDCDYHR